MSKMLINIFKKHPGRATWLQEHRAIIAMRLAAVVRIEDAVLLF